MNIQNHVYNFLKNAIEYDRTRVLHPLRKDGDTYFKINRVSKDGWCLTAWVEEYFIGKDNKYHKQADVTDYIQNLKVLGTYDRSFKLNGTPRKDYLTPEEAFQILSMCHYTYMRYAQGSQWRLERVELGANHIDMYWRGECVWQQPTLLRWTLPEDPEQAKHFVVNLELRHFSTKRRLHIYLRGSGTTVVSKKNVRLSFHETGA